MRSSDGDYTSASISFSKLPHQANVSTMSLDRFSLLFMTLEFDPTSHPKSHWLSLIRFILTYASEAWPLTLRDEEVLGIFEKQISRYISWDLGRAESTGHDLLGVYLHWHGVAANEACPPCSHARMDDDYLLQCTGLVEYSADDNVSPYWEARRQMKKTSTGVG
ncbi:hypothetical protein TNCV_939781 [Trichonephila clavipes]|nr:hypothetical protein TNCV_939781 [Trichonephila clavipes]